MAAKFTPPQQSQSIISPRTTPHVSHVAEQSAVGATPLPVSPHKNEDTCKEDQRAPHYDSGDQGADEKDTSVNHENGLIRGLHYLHF